MYLSILMPQPIKEFIVNYNHLKDLLAKHPQNDLNVRKTSYKAFLIGIHCLSAIALAVFNIAMFHNKAAQRVSLLIFSILTALNASMGAAIFSLNMGIAATFMMIYGIALRSLGILALGLIFGIIHYGGGKLYQSYLQEYWNKLDNYRDLHNLSGFDNMIYDHKPILDRMINWIRP